MKKTTSIQAVTRVWEVRGAKSAFFVSADFYFGGDRKNVKAALVYKQVSIQGNMPLSVYRAASVSIQGSLCQYEGERAFVSTCTGEHASVSM